MKKYILQYIIILIFILVAYNSFATEQIEYPAIFKTTSSLNIRQYPDRTSTKVGLIDRNKEIVVDSLYSNGWACITHKGNVAYISTKFIDYQHKVDENEGLPFGGKIKKIKLFGLIPLISVAGISILCFLIFSAISYLSFLSKDCVIYYVLMFLIGWIGSCLGDFLGCVIAICLYVGFFIFATILSNKLWEFVQFTFKPVYALNQLQHFLQKPWRPLIRNRESLLCKIMKMSPEIDQSQHPFQRFCYRLWSVWHVIISFVAFLIQFTLYIFCTPLRLINAIYYNIIVHIPCSLHDYIAEVFNPKGDGMRHLSKWDYWSKYFLKMPHRLYKFLLKRSLITTLESVMYTIIDIVVPTITMYHGTTCDASHKITGDNDVAFKVAGGNYAGSGIYFAIDKNTANHYSKGVVIISRVSLGRVLNVNLAPKKIRDCVAHNGMELTNWGLKNKVKTIEWWRTGTEWWEYCMLQPSGVYKDTWRIRPLYIENRSTRFKERIYKGMAPWIFK